MGRVCADPTDFLQEVHSISQAALSTVLIVACQFGLKYCIQILVHLGADIECEDASWENPLMIFIENRYLGIVCILVARRVDITIEDWAENNTLIVSISSVGSKEVTQYLLEQVLELECTMKTKIYVCACVRAPGIDGGT